MATVGLSRPLPGGPGEILVPCQVAIVAASQATIALDGLPAARSRSRAGAGLPRWRGSLARRRYMWLGQPRARGIIGASMVDADEVSGAFGRVPRWWVRTAAELGETRGGPAGEGGLR